MKIDFTKKFLIQLLKEELSGIPNMDNPDLFSIKKSLVIRDDDNGIEYTVSDVDLTDVHNPAIKCYRYNLDGTRAYIDIDKNQFKNYSRV
jgi:hypothetical protein